MTQDICPQGWDGKQKRIHSSSHGYSDATHSSPMSQVRHRRCRRVHALFDWQLAWLRSQDAMEVSYRKHCSVGEEKQLKLFIFITSEKQVTTPYQSSFDGSDWSVSVVLLVGENGEPRWKPSCLIWCPQTTNSAYSGVYLFENYTKLFCLFIVILLFSVYVFSLSSFGEYVFQLSMFFSVLVFWAC